MPRSAVRPSFGDHPHTENMLDAFQTPIFKYRAPVKGQSSLTKTVLMSVVKKFDLSKALVKREHRAS